MYQVLQDGIPADSDHYEVSTDWVSEHKSFLDAATYLISWALPVNKTEAQDIANRMVNNGEIQVNKEINMGIGEVPVMMKIIKNDNVKISKQIRLKPMWFGDMIQWVELESKENPQGLKEEYMILEFKDGFYSESLNNYKMKNGILLNKIKKDSEMIRIKKVSQLIEEIYLLGNEFDKMNRMISSRYVAERIYFLVEEYLDKNPELKDIVP